METTLRAVKRETRGKNEARRLRESGQIPAVLYGGDQASVALAVDPRALSRILHSETGVNSLISLDVEGDGTTQVLVKEYLLEPIKHTLLHADFYRVALDKVITVTVPVVLKGEARGIKQQDGVLDFVSREVQIECLPGDIPESIEVDVSDLLIGQSVRLRDVLGSATWTPVSDPDLMIAHVVPSRTAAAEETATPETPATTAEPEVVKKGKADKTEGE